MTSKWEMQSLFLLEAMSAEKPWVSTNVGSISELQGGIISKSSTKTLSSSLLKLIHEKELRDNLSKEDSTHWATEFSTAIVYNR